uniref:Tc1-like transposase DDE domain-containing protein n=1 Tax=Glossina morsitans morsitans TaxID=37546 RepID=A0A1B0FR29_GLOMM
MYHNSKYTSKTSTRRGGENVMVWAACFGHGIGYIHKTNTHVDKYVYKNLLVNTMIPYVEENMPLRWRFMHDNDPKHTSRTQRLHLNPIENLCNDVEQHISREKSKNLNDSRTKIQKVWYALSVKRCISMVNSVPRKCAGVIKN